MTNPFYNTKSFIKNIFQKKIPTPVNDGLAHSYLTPTRYTIPCPQEGGMITGNIFHCGSAISFLFQRRHICETSTTHQTPAI